MPSAILLITCEVGGEMDVMESYCSLPETEAAYLVFGVYDVVAKVTAETMDRLEGLLVQRIRKIPGIGKTVTLLVSKGCSTSEH